MSRYYEVDGVAMVCFQEIVEAKSAEAAVSEARKTLHALGQDVIELKVHNVETLDNVDFMEES